jgi:hypothetical protein
VGQRGHSRSRKLKFFLWKRNENHLLGRGLFVRHRIASVVNRAEIVSDRASYILLRGRRCNIIVQNVHSPTEERSGDSEDSCMRN